MKIPYICDMIIKFILAYLYKIIISNPWKLIFITTSIILWNFAGTIPNTSSTLTMLDSTHLDQSYQYIYKTIKDDKVVYNIYQSNVPLELPEGKLIISEYSSINVVLWILFVVSAIILCMLLLSSIYDDDSSWDFGEAFDYALSWFTRCYRDEKNGDYKYIYYAFGKLMLTSRYPNDKPNIRSLRSLRMLPDYEPKQEKRNKTIEKILKSV